MSRGLQALERRTLSLVVNCFKFEMVMLRQSNQSKLAKEILHSKLPDTI